MLANLGSYIEKKELHHEEENKIKLKEYVLQFCQKGDYCTAANAAVALSLCEDSDLFEFVIPLLVLGTKDCLYALEDYLRKFPDAVERMIKYLDDLSDNNRKKMEDLTKKYPKIPGAKFTTDSGSLSFKGKGKKPLQKTVKKYADKFGVLPSFYPRIKNWEIRCEVISLVKSKSTMTLEIFRHKIRGTVCENKDLHERLVSALKKENEIEEAKYWAQEFNLQEELQELEKLPVTPSCSYQTTKEDFFKLPVSPENIHIVSSMEKFHQVLEKIASTEEDIIGFDTEGQKPSLVQLSFANEVFLLDFEVLPSVMEDSDYEKLQTTLFMNSNVTIVGFASLGDLKEMAKSFKQFEELPIQCKNMIDLEKVQPKLISLLEPDESFQPQGLSQLCRKVLGKPLDKSEQRADWTKRPLSDSKKEYAALDAWVCGEIYKVMQSKVSTVNKEQEFKDLINEAKLNSRLK